MDARAPPALFAAGLASAMGAAFLGGHQHGIHQLLLAAPIAVLGALLSRPERDAD